MSTFLNRIKKRRESDRQLSYINYDGFRRLGCLRAFTVRLPVTTLAKMDLLAKKCPKIWDSKQEMIFEMIESGIADWIASTNSPEVADEFRNVAYQAARQHSPANNEPAESASEET
jgi:hypothetical protein